MLNHFLSSHLNIIYNKTDNLLVYLIAYIIFRQINDVMQHKKTWHKTFIPNDSLATFHIFLTAQNPHFFFTFNCLISLLKYESPIKLLVADGLHLPECAAGFRFCLFFVHLVCSEFQKKRLLTSVQLRRTLQIKCLFCVTSMFTSIAVLEGKKLYNENVTRLDP